LRSWVNQYKVDPFPEETLPPPLPKAALLDRYHSHTEKCASCRTALKNLQRLRVGLGVLIALIWTITPLLMLVFEQTSLLVVITATLLVLIAGGVWFGLGKLERQFYQGREIPPRNLPEK
jgi:hypothetical protein